MRRMTVTMATLGTLGLVLATTLSLPQTPTPTTAAPITDTAPAQMRLAADPTAAERDHLARVCKNDVAVKRHGHVVGRLNKGDKFKVIRPVMEEFSIEPVAYYGFAYGSVNAKGKVRAGALSCR
jgi:hypothetical protein